MKQYALFNSWENAVESTDYDVLDDAKDAANTIVVDRMNAQVNDSGSVTVWDRATFMQIYIASMNIQNNG